MGCSIVSTIQEYYCGWEGGDLHISHDALIRGTQRIVSVNYLFGRPLIPSDFLETFVTLNFRDMRNLMSVAFGLSKLSFLVPKKGRLSFSERREDLKFSGLDKKNP